MSSEIVLAVDGGNSKTDLALVRADGHVLAFKRGPQSSPHHLGVDGCLDVVDSLLETAVLDAGLTSGKRPVAGVAALLLAGVDFHDEEIELQRQALARGWAPTISVANDTFAVLRAGTERGWGVAVVCGAGINCVGVAPDGRHARFSSLGAITGDWGGGYDVGLAAVSAAARSEDGRGPQTSLERSVPAYFGLATPTGSRGPSIKGGSRYGGLSSSARLVLAEAETDAVAAGIVDRLAFEVAALARAALLRLGLERSPTEVLLGGGLLQAGDGRLLSAIDAELRAFAPDVSLHATDSRPIVGAALLALDELGAGPEAQDRLRQELSSAVDAEPEPDVFEQRYVEVD